MSSLLRKFGSTLLPFTTMFLNLDRSPSVSAHQNRFLKAPLGATATGVTVPGTTPTDLKDTVPVTVSTDTGTKTLDFVDTQTENSMSTPSDTDLNIDKELLDTTDTNHNLDTDLNKLKDILMQKLNSHTHNDGMEVHHDLMQDIIGDMHNHHDDGISDKKFASSSEGESHERDHDHDHFGTQTHKQMLKDITDMDFADHHGDLENLDDHDHGNLDDHEHHTDHDWDQIMEMLTKNIKSSLSSSDGTSKEGTDTVAGQDHKETMDQISKNLHDYFGFDFHGDDIDDVNEEDNVTKDTNPDNESNDKENDNVNENDKSNNKLPNTNNKKNLDLSKLIKDVMEGIHKHENSSADKSKQLHDNPHLKEVLDWFSESFSATEKSVNKEGSSTNSDGKETSETEANLKNFQDLFTAPDPEHLQEHKSKIKQKQDILSSIINHNQKYEAGLLPISDSNHCSKCINTHPTPHPLSINDHDGTYNKQYHEDTLPTEVTELKTDYQLKKTEHEIDRSTKWFDMIPGLNKLMESELGGDEKALMHMKKMHANMLNMFRDEM